METNLPNSITNIHSIADTMIRFDSIDLVNCLNNEFMSKTCEIIKQLKSNHYNYFLISESINGIAEIDTNEFNVLYLYNPEYKGLHLLYTDINNDNILAHFTFSLAEDHDIYNLKIKFDDPTHFSLILK